MDRMGADFDRAVSMLKEKFSAKATPINIPLGDEDNFRGIIDIINRKALIWHEDTLGAEYHEEEIPAEFVEVVEKYRTSLLETIADYDDELLEILLDDKEPTWEQILKAIRIGTIEHGFVPILCGSALKNNGIQPLLNAVVDFLPSPAELPPIIGNHPRTGVKTSRRPVPDVPFSSLAFKIAADPYVDRLTYLRIYSGMMKIGGTYLNPRTEKKERVQKIFRMHANKRVELQRVYADVVAVAGLRTLATGDTLCDSKKSIVFEYMDFPEPVIFVAVEPQSKADSEKLYRTISRLENEDPTFRHRENPETGQTIISGMGELHLEVLLDRMKREFGVKVNAGTPQVAYRETITINKKSSFTLERVIAGKKHYAFITIEVIPGEKGTGVIIEDALPAEHPIPQELRTATIRGIRSTQESGPVASYPLLDIIARILDIAFDEENTSVMDIEMATAQVFQQTVRIADPVLLEPVMNIEVIVSEQNLGDVMGDLGTKGAQIGGIDHRSDGEVVKAVVPLAEMFGYTTTLRSLTQGRGFFTMQFSHYRRLSPLKEEKMLLRVKGG